MRYYTAFACDCRVGIILAEWSNLLRNVEKGERGI